MRVVWLGCALLVLAACDGVRGDGRRTERAPSRASFDQVGEVLAKSCGSLDCHGQTSRNLRLYGRIGLRLADDAVSGTGDTTGRELDASYEALISIEPDILAQVVRDHDAPERLTVVRKARGAEHHKGNTVFEPDSDGDACLTSWLTTSKAPAEACQRVLDQSSPFEN